MKENGLRFVDLKKEEQERVRQEAVKEAISKKSMVSVICKKYGIAPSTLHSWKNKYKSMGGEGLVNKPKGPAPLTHCKLKSWQLERIKNKIIDKKPDQLKIPFVLWTREAVQKLILKQYKVKISIHQVGRYLKAWGLTPQKPIYQASERNDTKVKNWMKNTYSKIKSRAKKENAEIHWGDETGVQSTHNAGRSYSKKGKTPVIKTTAKRFSRNMISSITNKGNLQFMIYKESMKSSLFIEFMRRLIKHRKGKKIFFIVDNLSVHKSKEVEKWLIKHKEKIEVFYLPSYAPDKNPDEMVNNYLKQVIFKEERPQDVQKLEKQIRREMKSLQNDPKKVISFFDKESVSFAKAS